MTNESGTNIVTFKSDFKIGDYVMRGDLKGKVRGYAVGKDGRKCLCVQLCGETKGYPWRTWMWPEEECKRFETDTLEKIERDARKTYTEYWGCDGVECCDCPASINGEKPKERYGTRFCTNAIPLDLLARQRKVLERDAK